VGRLDVELRPVALEERRVPAALLLREHVRLGLELRVRLHAAGLRDHLAALDVRALETTEEQPDVVAGLARVEQLAEHLDAGHDGLLRLADAEDLDVLADLDRAAVDTTGGDRTAALDAEDVLDGHLERLVLLADRGRDVAVDGVHELEDRLELGGVDVRRLALERLARRATDDRRLRAVELVLGEQLTHFELHQLEELLVVDEVDLVEEDHDLRHLDLAREEDVLARLGHRTVGGRDDEDRAVHLRRAGDHVLDVVGVAGAVDVRVVALIRLVLDMGDRDGDAALLLFRSVVDRVEGTEV